MPFTGKFRVLNDIYIYQMGCQGIICVNTFAECHLKPNSSYLWASGLVFLNKVLYVWVLSLSEVVHVTTAMAWSPHPQMVPVWGDRG